MSCKNVNTLLQQSLQTCTHNAGAHTALIQCDKCIFAINDALEKGLQINIGYLCKYLADLFNVPTDGRGYGRMHIPQKMCVLKNVPVVKSLLETMFSKRPTLIDNFNSENALIMKYMLMHPLYDSCYEHLTKDGTFSFKPHDPFFDMLVQRLSTKYESDNNYLADFVVKNVQMTQSNITALCGCTHPYLVNYIAGIIDKTTEILDQSAMDAACCALPYTKPIIESLHSKKINISDKNITDVLKDGSVDSIGFIFNLVKMSDNLKITKQHYKTLLTSLTPVQKVIDGRNVIFKDKVLHKLNDSFEIYCFSHVDNYTPEKMMILINNGFVPDYDDILLSIRHQKEIPMIESFDIKLDNEFLKLCQNNSFYPKYNFKCISPELFELQSLCLIKNVQKVRTFLKKHNTLVPDSVCMENACVLSRNEKTIDLLINAGGVVSVKCLTLHTKKFGDLQTKSLFNNFLLNNTITEKKV